MMPGITQAMGATAILLSVVVRAIRSGASWQAIDDGVATQEHLRDVTGILNPETLQDIFGPPRLEDGVFRVTRAEVLRERTGMRRDSPALSTCSVKQKHSVLLKYDEAVLGAMLGTALPTIASP